MVCIGPKAFASMVKYIFTAVNVHYRMSIAVTSSEDVDAHVTATAIYGSWACLGPCFRAITPPCVPGRATATTHSHPTAAAATGATTSTTAMSEVLCFATEREADSNKTCAAEHIFKLYFI